MFSDMAEINEKIEQLHLRLENLVKYQGYFNQEISQIRYEISVLRDIQQKSGAAAQTKVRIEPPIRENSPPVNSQTSNAGEQTRAARSSYRQGNYQAKPNPNFNTSNAAAAAQTEPIKKDYVKNNLEKFIGENLISKIGIIVLVIGVAIGAKYAIDNNLISPLGRIVAGYIFGFGLLGFAVKLKEKYLNFSAVLLSGAMAIMYFITYFAYSLYEIFPQSSAFALMLIFTIFTVAAAINYNRQVIAHIGLVGAYAVPLLLSDNSGKYSFLFTYIAVINAGILAVSLKKYWKPLFYTSFIFTWATFCGFYLTKYQTAAHFNLALIFLTVFFLLFYLTFLGYKLISRQNIALENISLIFANSFIFYGFGYLILDHTDGYASYLGMFTVANAAIHFIFAFTVSRLNHIPKDVIYLLSALVLTFATIAVPVQLDGNYVTLAWTAEAAILFWIGRSKQINLYEYYSFPVMLIAALSLLLDWATVSVFRSPAEIAQNGYQFFNGTLITSLFFAAAFAFIHFLNKDERFEPALKREIHQPLSYLIPAIALFALYNTLRMQIGGYFQYQTAASSGFDLSESFDDNLQFDRNIGYFNILWQIDYTMFFLSVLAFVNLKKWKNAVLAGAAFVLNILLLTVFLTAGLYLLGELREAYLLQNNSETPQGILNILIRYFSYAFVAGLIFSLHQTVKTDLLRKYLPDELLKFVFDSVLYGSLWLILSSELINWMDVSGYQDSYKLGLSILWGIYALFLIVLGIYQNKKYLRIGAIVLFAITLAKLFLYDIAQLSTISKTIVMVSLGIILLIVSFLYNKYKSLIFETPENSV